MNPLYRQTIFRSAKPPPSGNPFGIVTAWNPHGKPQPEKANQEANTRLARELAARNLGYFPVTGGSPDFSHAEPGYGIFCDRKTAIELAKQFDQEAIFWIEAGNLFLVSCKDNSSESIGPIAPRWRIDPGKDAAVKQARFGASTSAPRAS